MEVSVLGTEKLGAFVATTDLAASRAFYVDVLGLTVVDDDGFALVLDANGTAVRVTPVEETVVAPYTVLGWEVDDAAATVAALVERGVTFARFDGIDQDDAGIWTAPSGTLVAWFRDPEGHVLSVSQAP